MCFACCCGWQVFFQQQAVGVDSCGAGAVDSADISVRFVPFNLLSERLFCRLCIYLCGISWAYVWCSERQRCALPAALVCRFIHSNQLSESIPVELGRLTALTYLCVLFLPTCRVIGCCGGCAFTCLVVLIGACEQCGVVACGGASYTVVFCLLLWLAGTLVATSCQGRFPWSWGG